MICGMVAVLLTGGCETARQSPEDERGAAKAAENASVAVSSPYLEAAIGDVLGREVSLVRLAGPAMCPGHFDVRPSQITDVARCRLLVRFDFQQSLDEKLVQRSGSSLTTLAVKVPDGLCVPESYLAACRQLADHFVSTGELSPSEAKNRLAQVSDRITRLGTAVAGKIDEAGLRDAPVLTSGHQTAFCRWLGLQVVGTFSGADTAGTREIDQTIRAGEAGKVTIIIANEPEGRRLADALADRLHARVVVFGNFPEPGKDRAFDDLVRRNLTALLAIVPSTGGQP
jgi:ABC-type Zn uptake system ZnuABC Zn-binding protein ZnuA